MSSRDQPLVIARRRFGGTTASALKRSHVSRVNASSASSAAMRGQEQLAFVGLDSVGRCNAGRLCVF
jgi:hypothetical protein